MSESDAESGAGSRAPWERLLPLLLVAVSLLPDLGAALPRLSYFFRDFSVTFYPLRLFAARELRAGRWPFWNPYIYEGSFALPVLYPLDLLHVLWPGPVGVSWLLTLHLPLAALCAYALTRDLKAGPLGAFVAGSVYALGGLALSSLNLYVFLQALALAPLGVLSLTRAARRGGRSIVGAGLVLAVSLTTLAVEFVAQALLLGLALGLADPPRRPRALRLLLALVLGAALAGVPVLVTAAMLSETTRGAGFSPDVALGNEVHPVALLQTLVPGLLGSLSSPVESWWGGRFFTKGFPYFLSLYVGPLALALAAAGAAGLAWRPRGVLIGGAALGLWYALGVRGGLAAWLSAWPLLRFFRFPSKAMLLPYLVVAVLAGIGASRLRRGEGWRAFGGAAAALSGVALVLASTVLTFSGAIADWARIERPVWPLIARAVAFDALVVALLGLVGAGIFLAVRQGAIAPSRAAWLLAGVVACDLGRAGMGMNPQVSPGFFDPLPELVAERLDRLDGGRVFSYGPDRSPSFLGFLRAGGPQLALRAFIINRQLLAPYNNILDRVETPEAKDLTSFVPRLPELGAEDYQPAAVGRVLPWLRNAAVSRVLSLDPLENPDLSPRAVISLGRPGLSIHVYELENPWPRAYLACRVVHARSVAEALEGPLAAGFDPGRDVVLEASGAASCHAGAVLGRTAVPGEVRYQVESDGDGYLVARDSFARGWVAEVGARRAPVLRANGKHQAVPIPAGRHEVLLRYEPPGLHAGLWAMALGLAAALVLGMRPVLSGEPPRG